MLHISLHAPSRTAVNRLVVNLYYTTTNVNYLSDVALRKRKEMTLQQDSRGRRLKSEEWPKLAATMEYVFGEGDILNRSGGVRGLESHPKLKDSILYKNEGNITTMKAAQQIINSISPPDFHISLSVCYNYTMGYKLNSASTKRHHHGQDVNA